MIYVVQTTSGNECEIVKLLANEEIRAYSPRHTLLERRKGIWQPVSRILFPGYVFVDVKLTNDIYYSVKNTPGVIRFLGEPTPLSVHEQKKMQWLFEAGDIGISTGHVKDGKLMITDGLLKGHEADIISFSIRQKRCKLRCRINGKKHFFSVSAMLDKV